jgi:hypothetical protein
MTRNKPVVPLVFGILNLIFGSLGMFAYLCCGAGVALFYVTMRALWQQAPAEDKRELENLWAVLSNNVPYLVPFVIASVAAALLMALIQIVSGIGLVRIRNWGRWLCAVWGLLEVVLVVVTLTYQVVYLFPGMDKAGKDFQRWAEKQAEKNRQRGQPQPPPAFGQGGTGSPILDNALTIVIDVFHLGYGGIAFLFMVLPQTGKAIARYQGQVDDSLEQRQDDLLDEDYQRKRRALDQPPEDWGPPPN